MNGLTLYIIYTVLSLASAHTLLSAPPRGVVGEGNSDGICLLFHSEDTRITVCTGNRYYLCDNWEGGGNMSHVMHTRGHQRSLTLIVVVMGRGRGV